MKRLNGYFGLNTLGVVTKLFDDRVVAAKILAKTARLDTT